MRKIMSSLIFFIIFISGALARSPLGIGVAEQSINPASPSLFLQIQAWQVQFERAIQKILVSMRDQPEGALWLIGLSFLYGILHAAGPGHGKAVISSYLIADHASLKRGLTLSFFSSILQALSAILIVLAIFLFLPGQLTQTTHFIIIISYALVMLVGLWLLLCRSRDLLWARKRPVSALFDNITTPMLPLPPRGGLMMASATGSGSAFSANDGQSSKAGKANLVGSFRQLCKQCGQIHLMEARHIEQKLRLKTALSLICATGLRPCNGALFVMSFALLNQLAAVGVMSVFMMALGTFITVSALASLAVYAKKIALKLSSAGGHTHQTSQRVKFLMEWGAALFIFIIGAFLLISTLI